jgi:hypothetical protein
MTNECPTKLKGYKLIYTDITIGEQSAAYASGTNFCLINCAAHYIMFEMYDFGVLKFESQNKVQIIILKTV